MCPKKTTLYIVEEGKHSDRVFPLKTAYEKWKNKRNGAEEEAEPIPQNLTVSVILSSSTLTASAFIRNQYKPLILPSFNLQRSMRKVILGMIHLYFASNYC